MRQSWDEYFMAIARTVATRATCTRRRVGAVLVKDRIIVAAGYNGSVRNAPHCDDVGCIVEDGHCVATVHAEVNAIIAAAKTGAQVAYSTAYVTSNPCFACFKALINAGVKKIVYDELYRSVDYSKIGLNDNTMPQIVQIGKDTTEQRSSNY